ncbi:MAG: hypothetical protein F9K30_22645, partial [Dechloromonas sp.]
MNSPGSCARSSIRSRQSNSSNVSRATSHAAKPVPPMNLLENMIAEDVTGANGGRKRKGLRLWRAEVLNWGTLGENVVHAADLRGDWLCITDRNGTGKSTLADAIITAFPP